MTPEAKVKKVVVKQLKELGCYYFYPVTGGYGRSGVPDIIACFDGKFIGIECKAGKNKPTPLQERNIDEINSCNGFALVVNEDNMHEVANILQRNHEPFLKSVNDALDYACELLAEAEAPMSSAKDIRTEIMSASWTRKTLTRQQDPNTPVQQEMFSVVDYGKTLISHQGQRYDLRCAQCKFVRTITIRNLFDNETVDLVATCGCGSTLIQRTTMREQVEWRQVARK
jgi:hypothetical protein|tara:strand:+ start:539 stop:1219 length:681 start_codon:yes stop_codon:yes gene_type:complete